MKTATLFEHYSHSERSEESLFLCVTPSEVEGSLDGKSGMTGTLFASGFSPKDSVACLCLMIFRITAKLGRKIGCIPDKSLPMDRNPYADWTARLFTARRVQYILVSNTASLYSMVMEGRGIADEDAFLDRVTRRMGEFICRDGHEFLYKRLVAPSMREVSFSKFLNRAVTGSMNELAYHAECHIAEDGIAPFDVGFRINETPLSCLKYSNPREAFRAMKPGYLVGPAG